MSKQEVGVKELEAAYLQGRRDERAWFLDKLAEAADMLDGISYSYSIAEMFRRIVQRLETSSRTKSRPPRKLQEAWERSQARQSHRKPTTAPQGAFSDHLLAAYVPMPPLDE